MSLNVGSISARFGLDPADFLEKLRGVNGATQLFSNEMTRSMRATQREGTESMRLIDEAIGLHISKPLTRLLTSEFPAFASAMQSVLGLGAVSALSAVGFEFFDKIAGKIEKAKKAQEEFEKSTEKLKNTFAEDMAGYEKSAKLRSLSGDDKANFKVDDASFEKAMKQVTALTEEAEKNAKAAADAGGMWNRFFAGVGDVAHTAFNSAGSLGVENTNAQFGALLARIEELKIASASNPLKGMTDALALARAEATKAGAALTAMQSLKLTGSDQFLNVLKLGLNAGAPKVGFSQEDIDAQGNYKKQAEAIAKLMEAAAKDDTATKNAEAAARALEKQVAAARSLADLQRDIATGMGKLLPEADPIKKLATEIAGLKMAAENDFRDIAESIASALDMQAAEARLKSYEARLDQVMAKARRDKDVADAAAKLPTTIAATGQAPTFGPSPNAMPNPLGVVTTSAAKFDVFSKDDLAQGQMAAQAYDAAMTAQDKYALGKRELDLLVQQGLINQQAYTAAMSQLDQAMVKASSSAHRLQEELQKMLERSDEGAAGLKAWALQMQIAAAENGKFVDSMMTAAVGGAEDNAINSFFAVLEEQRNGQRKLIADLENMWSSYFKHLASMAMKHAMDQMIAPLLKPITQGQQGQPQQDQQTGAQTSAPTAAATNAGASIFSKIFGGGLKPVATPNAGTNGAASLASAASQLSNAGTLLDRSANALTSAASALRASASAGSGGGGGGDDDSDSGIASSIGSVAGSAMQQFAAGGDATPGSSFISGEAGAE